MSADSLPRLRRPEVMITSRDGVVRAFLSWANAYEESPHKFLEETTRSQMTAEELAEWYADTFLEHLKAEVNS